MKKKEFKRIEKLMFFSLELFAQAVEMKKLQIKHQQAKNEEVVLKKDEPIDEKLKEEVENDPMFRLMEEIFSPEKNKERLEQIEKSLNLPKGAIAVKVVKREKDDVCDVQRVNCRQLEKGENGLN